ncbi:hypothetical protein SKAU_G00299650 [Synaphobranchus kaupii]|uniref:Uncharacterized protein n=1 Tax=Synaphobranchus kaupii TaxID=118154 RepID=A0A9Q1EVC3_SYNKA|nr:hypothetical protein SKAU_G00299650 [Synaphobranchus kaupii]
MSVNFHHGKKVNKVFQSYKEDVETILECLEQSGQQRYAPTQCQICWMLRKSARAGFIALNSIFMGLDVFLICKDSISLAKGSKSDVSKVIRGRASLWKTELDAWERIHHSLCIGIWRFRKSMEVLERPFYS